MSDVRYHINPETGNANKCNAMYNCRFRMSDSEHYETKEEAKEGAEIALSSENIDTNKYFKIVKKNCSFYENDNQHVNMIEVRLENIEKSKDVYSDKEKENLYRLEKMSDILKKKQLNEDDWNKAENLLNRMKSVNNPLYRSKWDARDENIRGLAKDLYLVRKAMDVSVPKNIPQREVNSGLIGSQKAQLENFEKFNNPGYDHMDGKKYLGDSADKYFDLTMDRIANGEEYKPFDDRADENYLVPQHDKLMMELDENNQLYMATAFPDNELKKEMDRVGLNNVSVSSFYNTREYGNAYTVMTPNGDTRTFSVYEHRNTDSIIINGKTNWKGADENDLPYVADSKNAFFAEMPYDGREQAARTLTYFLKNAQDGTLEDDDYLARNASRRDWDAILDERLPGFSEWRKERFPDDNEEDNNLSEDEKILKNLDFDSEN